MKNLSDDINDRNLGQTQFDPFPDEISWLMGRRNRSLVQKIEQGNAHTHTLTLL